MNNTWLAGTSSPLISSPTDASCRSALRKPEGEPQKEKDAKCTMHQLESGAFKRPDFGPSLVPVVRFQSVRKNIKETEGSRIVVRVPFSSPTSRVISLCTP